MPDEAGGPFELSRRGYGCLGMVARAFESTLDKMKNVSETSHSTEVEAALRDSIFRQREGMLSVSRTPSSEGSMDPGSCCWARSFCGVADRGTVKPQWRAAHPPRHPLHGIQTRVFIVKAPIS